jgi:cadmium resistance protein CadD (predicted permease)
VALLACGINSMENLFKLLLYIFIAVIIMVFVLERVGKPMDDQHMQKWSRWVIPLVALLLVIQLIRHFV